MLVQRLTPEEFKAEYRRRGWSGGGSRNDPDYSECEVYLIPAESLDKAKKKAQAIRARLVKKGSELPTQASPYQAN